MDVAASPAAAGHLTMAALSPVTNIARGVHRMVTFGKESFPFCYTNSH
jgi:hypothetical protein